MTSQEQQQREQVTAEARSWLRTPYRHMARVKGHGADCAMFPLEVYASLGLIAAPEIAYYPLDWHLHRDAERYLEVVTQLAREVAPLNERAPLPGDFLVVKFGRCFAHGLIVLDWPLCIHAHLSHGVQLVDASIDPQLADRPTKVFVLPGWGNAQDATGEGEQAAKPIDATGKPGAAQGRNGGESTPPVVAV